MSVFFESHSLVFGIEHNIHPWCFDIFCLGLTLLHVDDSLLHTRDRLTSIEAPNQAIQSVIEKLKIGPMTVKIIANTCIHPKTKIVCYLFQKRSGQYPHFLPVLWLCNIPILSVLNFNLPHIKILNSRKPNLSDKLFQVLKAVVKQFILSPSKILCKIVPGTQGESSKNDFVKINFDLN